MTFPIPIANTLAVETNLNQSFANDPSSTELAIPEEIKQFEELLTTPEPPQDEWQDEELTFEED